MLMGQEKDWVNRGMEGEGSTESRGLQLHQHPLAHTPPV